jgi:hypothetical protein
MNNKATKNLIILGIFVFSYILAGSAQAAYNPYDSSYWLMPVSNNSIDDYTGSYTYYNSYQTTDRNTNGTSTTSSTVKPTTINNYNYYYQNDPSTTAKTNTTTKTTTNNTTIDKTSAKSNTNTSDQVAYENSLGGSAYTGYNGYNQSTGSGITALSIRGSGGFMPSSIWQWILVVILILIIIIISRVLINKRHVVQESHTVHTH